MKINFYSWSILY